MSEKDNGGPAFPNYKRIGEAEISEGGMSLRDYFASKALPTLLADFDYQKAVRDSYVVADLMIAERNR